MRVLLVLCVLFAPSTSVTLVASVVSVRSPVTVASPVTAVSGVSVCCFGIGGARDVQQSSLDVFWCVQCCFRRLLRQFISKQNGGM